MNFQAIEVQNRIKSKRRLAVSGNTSKRILDKKNSNYISNLFTRTLISVILVLGCAIFINIKDENLLFFKDKLFNETLAFTKINELYTKYFGAIVPEIADKTTPVFNETPKTYSNITPFNDSYKVTLNNNTLNYFESGIVVFSGEKEDYGYTVIIQGIDGVDIWYSNLENPNVTMYDYVSKGEILGEVKNNEVILTFVENGEFIGYEKYIS